MKKSSLLTQAFPYRTIVGTASALLLAVVVLAMATDGVGQRTTLLFREDWKQIPAAIPVTQDHVAHSELVVSRHGPDADSIKKSHHDNIKDDPWYIWSGSCQKGRWALSLRMQHSLVDLSSGAHIRWRTRQSGGHVLKIVLELEDGTWLVSDKGFGETPDWWVFDVDLKVFRWHRLDIQSIEAGPLVKEPDLSRVRSVGWTDLMVGDSSKACTRVDWIEVYGRAVRLRSRPEPVVK